MKREERSRGKRRFKERRKRAPVQLAEAERSEGGSREEEKIHTGPSIRELRRKLKVESRRGGNARSEAEAKAVV